MPATSFSNLITFSRGTNATVTDSTGRLTYAPNNLFTLSEQFDNAAWSKFATTVTANATTAPDGSTTADQILETTANSTHLVAANAMVSVVTGQSYTISVYVKPSGRNWFRINSNFSGGSFASFDIANGVLGTVSGGTASITDAGNGWWRCSLTVVATSTGTASPDFRLATSNATISYTGNASLGVFLWGAQMEAVTYQTTPSTYYPTTVKNLLGFSQDFSNAAWSKVAASITNCPYVNPVNGLFTAQKLMEDTANATHRAYEAATVASGTPYAFSVYARAAERSRVQLISSAGVSFDAIFDLSDGTVVAATSGTASITALGNGWYRCAVINTASSSTSTNLQIRIVQSGTINTYTGDGNSGIYIYGAQLSDSASLDPYVPTPAAAPSSTAYYGPRFDYDPVTLAPKGLLVEEARTNLFTYSEQFDNAAWVPTNQTVTPNSTTSPGNTATADTLNEGTGTGSHNIGQNFSSTSGVSYAFSAYFKNGDARYLQLFFGGGGHGFNAFANFDLQTGTVGTVGSSATASIVNAGNGWYRCVIVAAATATTVNASVQIAIVRSSTSARAENFTGTNKFIYAWGAQLEAGAFATSYIPTVASTVTRSADVASITGSLFNGWYRQDEGTFVFQGTPLSVSGFSYAALANDTTNNNRFGMYRSAAAVSGLVVSGGVTQMDIAASSVAANVPFKMAVSAQANNGNFACNNVLGALDTAIAMPAVTRLDVGCFGSGSQINGHIRSIQYIPNATSATQLQTLTLG